MMSCQRDTMRLLTKLRFVTVHGQDQTGIHRMDRLKRANAASGMEVEDVDAEDSEAKTTDLHLDPQPSGLRRLKQGSVAYCGDGLRNKTLGSETRGSRPPRPRMSRLMRKASEESRSRPTIMST